MNRASCEGKNEGTKREKRERKGHLSSSTALYVDSDTTGAGAHKEPAVGYEDIYSSIWI